ncbi:MAG TPA: Hsp20/alpha crystallin family protein [Roseiarcus sp.]|nr:Hsp20/alpha crystallin family protein [Roseiarcus sp.]
MCRFKPLTLPARSPAMNGGPLATFAEKSIGCLKTSIVAIGDFRFRRSLTDWEPRWLGETAPAVDVAEKEKAFEVTAELPGIDQNNVEVKLANDVLTIKGEKKQETEEKKKNYYMSERRYGSFERSFQVPEGVDQDKIEASFNKGVLTVTLPKSVEAQKSAKTITVKAA